MLDANANVDVDLAGKTVKIETTVHLDAVKSVIEDAGYDVIGV
jgi:copper chaperone CopZ